MDFKTKKTLLADLPDRTRFQNFIYKPSMTAVASFQRITIFLHFYLKLSIKINKKCPFE